VSKKHKGTVVEVRFIPDDHHDEKKEPKSQRIDAGGCALTSIVAVAAVALGAFTLSFLEHMNDNASAEPQQTIRATTELDGGPTQYTRLRPSNRDYEPDYQSSGRFVVQIGAWRTSDAAMAGYEIASQANRRLMREGTRIIVQGKRERGPVVWRAQVGYFRDRGEARQLCGALRDRGQDCFVVDRGA